MKRALLVLALLAACDTRVQHGLDEAQANEIEALLNAAGIASRKVAEGGRDARWAIAVPSKDAAAAITLLNDHDLPRARPPGFAEVFGKASMVPSTVEETARFVQALSGEVAQTLASLEGVVSARVHLVASPPSSRALVQAPPRPRASVLLKVRPGFAEALSARVDEVRALVAGSVEAMEPSSVAVMFSELPAAPVLPPRPKPQRHPGPGLALAAVAAAVASTGCAAVALWVRGRKGPQAPAAAPPHAAGQPGEAALAPESHQETSHTSR